MQKANQEPEQRHKLREQFLEAFVRAMIINSYDPKKDKELQEELMKDRLAGMTEDLKKTKPIVEYVGGKPLPKMPTPTAPPPTPQEIYGFHRKFGLMEPRPHPSPGKMPRLSRYNPVPLPKWQPSQMQKGQKPETINLGKLAAILVDPSVFSVECPGPYKNLLVNRGGNIQTSGITLTPEEVNAVMHNISEQTRIPLMPGVFRAAVQDLLVTAVISDYVGTRFMVQKRNPFQRY